MLSNSRIEANNFALKIELDESYFGGTRKGKRGRGAAGKVAVFRLLKRGGKVYTQIILDAKSDTLMPIIPEKIEPDSIVYTDCGVVTTHWMSLNSSILELTTALYLPIKKIILTVP